MRIALVGIQKSGKTAIFNALTGQQAETSAYVTGRQEANLASVKVPDARLDRLSELYKPKKHTPTAVQYVDLAGIARGENQPAASSLGDKQLHEIGTADALLVVVREFPDLSGAAPDVEGDVEAMLLEMALSDLAKVEGRLERLPKQIARAKENERKALQDENDALLCVRSALEGGRAARCVELTEDQARGLRGFQLLTMKPTLFLLNADEACWEEQRDQPVQIAALAGIPRTAAERLCGSMEMEIAQLPPDERAEFLETYAIKQPAAQRVIRLCYDLMERISFFTVGEDECRAWTVERNTPAQKAAGEIHSDLERGFIRAEVIEAEELLALGSMAEAKRHGKLRIAGKQYLVKDGEIMHVLFSV